MVRTVKTKRVQLRAEPAFVNQVQVAAFVADYPSAAEFVREAVKEKIEKLSKRFPQIKETAETEQIATA